MRPHFACRRGKKWCIHSKYAMLRGIALQRPAEQGANRTIFHLTRKRTDARFVRFVAFSVTDRLPCDPSFWLPFASLWFELDSFPLSFHMAFQPPRGLLPMLHRQNYPQQPSPAASNHHGNMYGNNTAGTRAGFWDLAMDAPLRPGQHRLHLQLHANPTATPLPTSIHRPGPRPPFTGLPPPPTSPAAPLPPPPRRPPPLLLFAPSTQSQHQQCSTPTTITTCAKSGTAGGCATSPMEVRYASLSRCRSQSSPQGYSAKSDNDILTWMPSLFTLLHRRAPRPPNQQP